jgi:23S rRNA pseudouridine2457 synthase
VAKLLLFNKPCQVLSQFRDSQGRQTLADYIDIAGVYPAGRLDYDSEGLLLLCDDGKLQHRIAHPRQKMRKHYLVQLEGEISASALNLLHTGVELKDGSAQALSAKRIPEPQLWPRDPPIRQRKNLATSWIELCIDEGRNRQVRRMTAAAGFPTLRLVRWRIGDWTLDELTPGAYRITTVHVSRRPGTRKPAAKRARHPR